MQSKPWYYKCFGKTGLWICCTTIPFFVVFGSKILFSWICIVYFLELVAFSPLFVDHFYAVYVGSGFLFFVEICSVSFVIVGCVCLRRHISTFVSSAAEFNLNRYNDWRIRNNCLLYWLQLLQIGTIVFFCLWLGVFDCFWWFLGPQLFVSGGSWRAVLYGKHSALQSIWLVT